MKCVRRLLIGVGLCAVLGVSGASASHLPVTAAPAVGAGDGTVSSCDVDGVTVSYTSAFDTTMADYRTSAVVISGVDTPCAGHVLKVTVQDATGAALFEGSATVSGTSVTVSAATPFKSSAVAGWAVTVTG